MACLRVYGVEMSLGELTEARWRVQPRDKTGPEGDSGKWLTLWTTTCGDIGSKVRLFRYDFLIVESGEFP